MASGLRFDDYITTAATVTQVGVEAPVCTVPFGVITVYTDDTLTTLSSIFTDENLTTPMVNPITADGEGRFGFWGSPNAYVYTVQRPGGGPLLGTYYVYLVPLYSSSSPNVKFNLSSLVSSPSTSLTDGQQVDVANCSISGDGGGGIFIWDASSTSMADGGVVLIPSDRTVSESNVLLATGDGNTTSFSGVLSSIGAGVVPASFLVTAGGAPSAKDLGFTSLVGNGVYGTINYSTGAWSLNFSQPWSSTITYASGSYVWYSGVVWKSLSSNTNMVPPNNSSNWMFIATSSTSASIPLLGQVIQASYQYENASGRWVRQFSGNVDIRWFGANPTSDMQPGWAKCDYYSETNGLTVYIPSIGQTGWTLNTPMVVTAFKTSGDGSNYFSESSTLINFQPASITDLLAAITMPASDGYMEYIAVRCPDSLPSSPAALVSSGWIIAQWTGTGTIAGNTFTVVSTTSGALSVGQSISGAGMAPAAMGNCVITAGSGSTWTISISQTVSTPIAITSTNLPNYNAIKAGTAAWSLKAGSTLRYCRTISAKVGFLFSSNSGHIYLDECAGNALVSIYNPTNSGDYRAHWCDFTGPLLASILTGSQGIDINLEGTHIGFSPFGILQLNNTGNATNSGDIEFVLGSLEAFGEALCQFPPTSAVRLDFVGTSGVSFDAPLNLPTSLVPVPRTYTFQILGELFYLQGPEVFNAFYPGNLTPVLGAAYIGSVNVGGASNIDLDLFSGHFTLNNSNFPNASIFDPTSSLGRYDRFFQRRSEKLMLTSLAHQGNLLINPEIVSNWTAGSAGSTVTINPLATLLTGALAGFTVPRRVYEEAGPNPNVIVIQNTGGVNNPSMLLAVNSLQPVNVNRAISFSAWAAISPTGGTFSIPVVSTTGAFYGGTFTSTANAFVPTMWMGTTLAAAGKTALARINPAGTATADVIYLIAPMLCYDDIAPYSVAAGPTLQAPLSFSAGAQYTVAMLPSASWFSNGAMAFATNGRNTGEAPGAGTGCPVFVKLIGGVNTWCGVWSGIAVQA